MTEVVLIGGGGHAKVVLDSFNSEGRKVVGVFDGTKSGDLMGVPFINQSIFESLHNKSIVIAIGDNQTRKRLTTKVGQPFTKTIHTSSIVASNASIGEGSMILHGTILQPFVKIGNHVIANTGCRIDHDSNIGDYAHIAPGVVLCGNVTIGEGTLVGAGAVVIPGITIGKWAVIGAGAVVTRDIPDYAVAVGNPAKIIKTIKKDE